MLFFVYVNEIFKTFFLKFSRYRWFARFLLEGRIVTSLKPFAVSLLSRPETMVKTWAK